jgi:proteic killer suppression protein
MVCRPFHPTFPRESPLELNVPGYRLHQLKGNQKGIWSITISGNWRITFRFDGAGANDVDLIDYP